MGVHASETSGSEKLRVVIVGAGVAGLETALALGQLAPDLTEVTVIAPDTEFVYRPMVVREPFAYGPANRYPVAQIVREAGATLLESELESIDPVAHMVHTKSGQSLEYG